MTLNVRIEFTNIFNRTFINNPTSTNPQTPQVRSSTGQTTSGFGFIDTTSVFSQPRQGQLVAQFHF